MKMIMKTYMVLKDGNPVAKESITTSYNAKAVNEAYKELWKKYPYEEGYWLVHMKDLVFDREVA